jgi:glycosyltransferase involved in cell wall biosynthesis
MKVGLALYGSLDERSGGFRYDRKLVAGLRAAGDDVEVVELPWRAYPRGLLDNVSPRFRRRLDVDVDVLLQDELAHPSLVRPNRHLSSPIVSVVHHLRSSENRRLAPLYRRVERRYLDTVDAAICNSEATRQTVTAVGAVSPDRTIVAPPAGDKFDPEIGAGEIAARAVDGPLRLVFVGNVVPRKGLSTLVAALTDVEADCELAVVGRPVDRRYLRRVRRRADAAGLDDRVRFAGELPDDELAAVLRRSHALAVPSEYEGLGIVYLEAASFGLPSIATTAGGAGEVVTEGETGFLVDPGDRAAIAQAVETLATDRDRLAEMGRVARGRYEQRSDWSETVDRVRGFLREVAESRSEVVPA